MNSSSEVDIKKKRKRSDTSSRRSSSQSNKRRSSRKDKKRKRSKSKSRSRSRSTSRSKKHDKKKRSKRSKSSRRKEKKEKNRSRSKSHSPSSESEDKMKDYLPIPPMEMMYYPLIQRDPRMRQMYFPPFAGDPYNVRMRPPTPVPIVPKIDSVALEPPTDKIVKDQNFLNSDEKLFESIVSHEMGLRSLFEDCQLSETFLGPILYKTIKKIVHDPNTTIFECEKTLSQPVQSLPRPIEVVNLAIEDYIYQRSEGRHSIKMGELTGIREQILALKDKSLKEEGANIAI